MDDKKITSADLNELKLKLREKIKTHGTGVLSDVLDRAHNHLGQIRDGRVKVSAEYALAMLEKIDEWERGMQ